MWKNWRTSLAGIATIAAGAAGIVNAPSNDVNTLTQSVAAILAGIGLLTAKDSNVTGGTVASSPEAEKRVEEDKEK